MTDDISLEIKQVFDAPISKVWDAWTNPDSLKQWKSPEGMTTPEVSVDLKVGGKYKVVMVGMDQANPTAPERATVGGEYLEIDEPNRLVYTWLWEGAPAATHTTTVTVKLNKINDHQTEVILIQSGFVDQNMKEEHAKGWHSTFNKLNVFLKGGE